MTFRLRHEWTSGARVNGADLATCPHCATLRVTLMVAGGADEVHFIRRISDAPKLEGQECARVDYMKPDTDPDARVTRIEPRCLSPAEHFRAPW